MSSHHFVFDISVGEFICEKCLISKDDKDAILGCGTPAQKQRIQEARDELNKLFDENSISLAVSGLTTDRLEKRLWPGLKSRLDEIYERATGEKP